MPGDAEEGIEIGTMPLVLTLAPCGGVGFCPQPPLPWPGGSGEMPGGAEEGIGIEMLPLVLSLAPCGGACCCPRPPLPWRWGRPDTIVGPWTAGGSGEMPGDVEGAQE